MLAFFKSSSTIEITVYLASMSANARTLSSHTLYSCQPMPVCHINNFMPRTSCVTPIASTIPSLSQYHPFFSTFTISRLVISIEPEALIPSLGNNRAEEEE
jgi:hypothetical protein